MKTVKELKELLETIKEEILSGKKYNEQEIKSFDEYRFLLGQKDILEWMLQPKPREKKEVPEKILPEFGLINPVKKHDKKNK